VEFYIDLALRCQVGLKGKKITFVCEHVLADCSCTQEVEGVVNGCQKLGARQPALHLRLYAMWIFTWASVSIAVVWCLE